MATLKRLRRELKALEQDSGWVVPLGTPGSFAVEFLAGQDPAISGDDPLPRLPGEQREKYPHHRDQERDYQCGPHVARLWCQQQGGGDEAEVAWVVLVRHTPDYPFQSPQLDLFAGDVGDEGNIGTLSAPELVGWALQQQAANPHRHFRADAMGANWSPAMSIASVLKQWAAQERTAAPYLGHSLVHGVFTSSDIVWISVGSGHNYPETEMMGGKMTGISPNASGMELEIPEIGGEHYYQHLPHRLQRCAADGAKVHVLLVDMKWGSHPMADQADAAGAGSWSEVATGTYTHGTLALRVSTVSMRFDAAQQRSVLGALAAELAGHGGQLWLSEFFYEANRHSTLVGAPIAASWPRLPPSRKAMRTGCSRLAAAVDFGRHPGMFCFDAKTSALSPGIVDQSAAVGAAPGPSKAATRWEGQLTLVVPQFGPDKQTEADWPSKVVSVCSDDLLGRVIVMADLPEWAQICVNIRYPLSNVQDIHDDLACSIDTYGVCIARSSTSIPFAGFGLGVATDSLASYDISDGDVLYIYLGCIDDLWAWSLPPP